MNKTVVVTGAAMGIGRATSETFLNAGWRVFGIDIRAVGGNGNAVSFIEADVSDPASLDIAFNKIESEVDCIDALVNNAAIQVCKPLVETDIAEWDKVMDTNLRSMYLVIKRAYPLLFKHGGAVVNVASVHAVATSANIAAYAASKGAALALTRALALEFGGNGIRVNAVLPGAVDTGMLRDGLSRGHLSGGSEGELIASLGRRTPLGRVGRPEEIAEAILFLSDNSRSSFITGAGLAVDGGALARLGTE